MTALGAAVAVAAAPVAAASPDEPADPPAPTILVADAATAPATPETPTEIGPAAADAVAPALTDSDVLTAAAEAITPADGVAHLPSPDNPPPGTSTEAPEESGRVGYLRDLWHAVRTQDVTMTDALLLFTQRSLDGKAPPPGMATTPRSQLGPSDLPLAEPVPDAAAVAPAEESAIDLSDSPLTLGDTPAEGSAVPTEGTGEAP